MVCEKRCVSIFLKGYDEVVGAAARGYAAASTARLLLHRLQHAVSMYEELRNAMDGAMLARFEESLGDAFAGRRVKKAYVALTADKPSKKQGVVAGDMIKSRRGSWRCSRTAPP